MNKHISVIRNENLAVYKKENRNMEWGKAKKNTESSVAVLTSVVYVNWLYILYIFIIYYIFNNSIQYMLYGFKYETIYCKSSHLSARWMWKGDKDWKYFVA